VQKGEKTVGLFSYINDIGQSGKEQSTATKFEDYCDISFVNKTFKAITLYVISQA